METGLKSKHSMIFNEEHIGGSAWITKHQIEHIKKSIAAKIRRSCRIANLEMEPWGLLLKSQRCPALPQVDSAFYPPWDGK